MSNPKWEIGPVKLVNGEQGFIDAINEGQHDHYYTGRMPSPNGYFPTGWKADGSLCCACYDKGYDLAPPAKRTMRVQGCIVFYANGSWAGFSDKDSAMNEAYEYGSGLFEFDRVVEEGEGLS